MPARRRLARRAPAAPRTLRRPSVPDAAPSPARPPGLDPLGHGPVRRALRADLPLHAEATPAPTEVLEVVSGPYERPIALRGRS